MLNGLSSQRACLFLRNAAFAMAGLLGVTILIRLILVRSWNYDELSHAHLAWLVSVGCVPYQDFSANHFPFLWLLVSPLMHVLPQSPITLVTLRAISLTCNFIYIGWLCALIVWDMEAARRAWAVAFFLLVAFSPISMHYLIEFRPDPIGNVLLFSAIGWLWWKKPRTTWGGFLGGFLIGPAVLINTKCVTLVFSLAIVSAVMNTRLLWGMRSFIMALIAGFLASLAAGLVIMVCMRISLHEVWWMAICYNVTAEKSHTLGFGLTRAIMEHPILLGYVLAGAGLYVVLLLIHKQRPGILDIAIAIFLILNLTANTRPWKQYVTQWFFLAAYYPARSLPLIFRERNPIWQTIGGIVFFAIMYVEFASLANSDPNGGTVDRQTQDALIAYTSHSVPAGGYVVADLTLHPVFRRDSFFKTVIDITANELDGMEKRMPLIAATPYSEHFQKIGYEREISEHPPALIVAPLLCTPTQTEVVENYLKQHMGDYDFVKIPDTSVSVFERKDVLQSKSP